MIASRFNKAQPLLITSLTKGEKPGAGEDDRHATSFWRANVIGTALSTLAVLPLIAAHLLAWGTDSVWGARDEFHGAIWWWLAAFVVGLVVHEAVHGLCWAWLSGHSARVIRFGIHWRTCTPFAHCREPMPATAYRIGTALSGVLTGVLPAAVGTALALGGLAMFGWLMTLMAGGDLLVLLLLRGVAGSRLIKDHPTRAGCVVQG
jgi:hypothetical protein